MKKVIFVCLLSLSVCLSQPTDVKEATSKPPAAAPLNPVTDSKSAKNEPAPITPTQTAANGTATVPPTVHTENATTASIDSHVPAPNESSTKPNETKPTDNKADKPVEPKPADDKKVDPPKEKNDTKPVVGPTEKPAGNSTSTEGKKNETTTPKGEIVAPTVAPTQAQSRAFDGPSFIGGIILTLGLLAIGFMGFKYYKNQTERNYHTL